MSKRSYRRLAVVAGAALALGSAAPAMASRVVSANSANADVSVDSVDVSSILGGAQSQLSTTGPLSSISSVQTLASSTVSAATIDAQRVVGGAVLGAQCLLGAGTSAVLGLGGLAADANAGLAVGLGGVYLGASLDAIVGAPLTLIGTAQGCIAPLQLAATGAVSHLQGTATSVAGFATSTALTTVSSAPYLAGGMVSSATPLLLGNLLNLGVSGGASSTTVAGLEGLVNFL